MGRKKGVLVVDDELKMLAVITSFLESKDYYIYQAETGLQALEIFEQEPISLILLDLMLPDISGEDLCKRIRKQSRVPIIMLTAKAEESDMIHGLNIGADDYISKPFSLKELAARIEAVLRRASDDLVPLLSKYTFFDGDLIVDFEKNIVKKKQEDVNLTRTELNILSALMKYPGKVFTRSELIESAMGYEYLGFDRAVDSHIKNLRHKIEEDPKNPVYILTIHGKGYKFGGES